MDRKVFSRAGLLVSVASLVIGVVGMSCTTGPFARGVALDERSVHDEARSHELPVDPTESDTNETSRADDPVDETRIDSDRDTDDVAAAARPGPREPVVRPAPAVVGRHHEAELDAIEHRSAGEYLEAISAYARAVRIAIEDETPADVVDRLATTLEETIREIRLTKRTDNLIGVVRRPLDDAFVLEVSAPGGPIRSVPITVGYRDVRADGRTAVRTASLQTDASGRVEFFPPSLIAPGRETVTMVLDLSPYIVPVTSLDRDDAAVDRIRAAAAEKRAVFVYIVESRAREITTSVAVVETDIAGNPLATDTTANAMIQLLSGEGFAVTPVTVDARASRNLRGEDAVRFLRGAVEPDVQRVVYGSVRITAFEEDNGFVVTVSGEVSVIELGTGETVSRATGTQRSRGQSSAAAISAAFRAIGIRLAQDIVDSFP